MTSFRANEKLLSVLSRKSPQQFQLFLDALDNCGQRHVFNVINDQRVSGKLVHTLPEGKVVVGVTSLGEHIYLLRLKEHDEVEVYDVTTYHLVRCLTVPNSRSFDDMTSCEHFLCLYISDDIAEYIHRLDLEGNAEQWPVNDEPTGLSVNADHNLIVTCRRVRKIKEFSPRGDLLREVTLCSDIIKPWHAILLTNGQFIVCHGDDDYPIHRVCKLSGDGRNIVHSHGARSGSGPDQYNVPLHFAVDNNEFVFVVDAHNRRVTLLTPTLNFIRHVVSSHQFKWKPFRLYLDVSRGRLFVTDNEVKNRKAITGRVVVFSV